MARYVCTRPCWHGKRHWRLGDLAEFEENDLPRHKDGTIAHFKPLGKAEPAEVPENPAEAGAEAAGPSGGVEVNVNQKRRKVK